MHSKLKTAALSVGIIATAALGIALISGLLYEQSQRGRDRQDFPPIGRAVDIGGRTLDIYCSGTGQPAVILERGAPWMFYTNPRAMFEDGAPRPGYGWVGIQRELAKTTTTCWYDRAGSGWSDLGPYPRDSASQARDLHALLQRAGVPAPYVLVAEASAALDAHVYVGFYPAEVAGLVFVNGVHPDLFAGTRPGNRRLARLPGFFWRPQDAMAQAFNQIGIYRFGRANRTAPAPAPQGITPAEWSTIWHLTQSSKARSALLQDIAAFQQSTEEAQSAGSLGDRPLLVLSAENMAVATEHRTLWADLQNDLAHLSTRGKHVVIGGTDGDLIYDAPGAILDASRRVVADVRQPPEGAH